MEALCPAEYNSSMCSQKDGDLMWWHSILQKTQLCARKETENVRNHDMTDALWSKFRSESENHTNRARGQCFVRFSEQKHENT